jgi:hypothetical protein
MAARFRPILRSILGGWRHLLAGLGITLFMAWGLPLALSMRGIGAVNAPRTIWFREPGEGPQPGTLWSSEGEGLVPILQARRAAFSDWYVAEPSSPQPSGEVGWPDRALETRDGVPHAVPTGVIASPPPAQTKAWGRVDTGLAGWPFRAFASEAWYRSRGAGGRDAGYDPNPEFRWNAHIGMVDGMHVLVPLRPLAFGFLADLVFWSSASWMAIALPRAIRRRRRETLGRCGDCGHDLDPHAVARPSSCPECGVALPRDPLGFARSPEMHFQNTYVWFVFVSSLDIMLTWKILSQGGLEVNPVAAIVIDAWGMHGAIAFKFALMMWVIVVCEVLARLRRSAGRFLATTAVVMSALPVLWSLTLLLTDVIAPDLFAE